MKESIKLDNHFEQQWEEQKNHLKELKEKVRNKCIEINGDNIWFAYKLDDYFKKVKSKMPKDEERFKFLAFHVITGSTPSINSTPYLDFDDEEISVQSFLTSLLDELEAM